MEVMTEKLELQLDKSSWTPVKFGDVVKEPKENCKDPLAEGIEHVVGLEHITSGDIHLRNSAGIEESTTFTKRFAKGDVLFGRRRAYLKKAAQANFDGICSGDITVFRAKTNLLPELLPFIVNNERFFDYAIKHSAGGLSPRVKFKDLANYEFLLPPKAEQARLAKLLWAMDEVIEREKEVLERFEVSLFSLLKNSFNNLKDRKSLIDLCAEPPKYGANSPAVDYDGEIRYLRITDIGNFGNLNEEKVSASEHDDKYLLKYGDFLLARSADPGRSYYYTDSDGKCTHAGYLIKFSLDLKKILPEFLYFFTQTKEFKLWINQTTRTGTLSNINSQEFSRLQIPFTSIENQLKIIEEINKLFSIYLEVKAKISSSQALLKSLINQLF
jgi:type I restriction enzyme, S subunit